MSSNIRKFSLNAYILETDTNTQRLSRCYIEKSIIV